MFYRLANSVTANAYFASKLLGTEDIHGARGASGEIRSFPACGPVRWAILAFLWFEAITEAGWLATSSFSRGGWGRFTFLVIS